MMKESPLLRNQFSLEEIPGSIRVDFAAEVCRAGHYYLLPPTSHRFFRGVLRHFVVTSSQIHVSNETEGRIVCI